MFDKYGDETQHPAITAWAVSKFKLDPKAKILVKQETIGSGYCETCYYEEEYWIVYQEVQENGKVVLKQLERFAEDFGGLLREILDFTVATKETK